MYQMPFIHPKYKHLQCGDNNKQESNERSNYKLHNTDRDREGN